MLKAFGVQTSDDLIRYMQEKTEKVYREIDQGKCFYFGEVRIGNSPDVYSTRTHCNGKRV